MNTTKTLAPFLGGCLLVGIAGGWFSAGCGSSSNSSGGAGNVGTAGASGNGGSSATAGSHGTAGTVGTAGTGGGGGTTAVAGSGGHGGDGSGGTAAGGGAGIAPTGGGGEAGKATAGSGGHAGGSGGKAGGGGAAGSGGVGFMSVAPCTMQSEYMTGSTIMFGGTLGMNFSPKCLKVSAGAMVTFSGMFSAHPLAKSTRGTAGNPIQDTSTGTSAVVTFSSPGFFPYRCMRHSTADDGDGMSGVVWVQ